MADNNPYAEEVKDTDVDVVKCPNCGANMLFDAGKGALVCPYCDGTVAVDAEKTGDRDYFRYADKGEVDSSDITFRCPNCNAITVFSEGESAHECPFCGSTCIVDKEQLPGLKPDSVIAFGVTREQALDSGKKWIKKRYFSPAKLKKSFVVDNIRGVYIPCFTFSSTTFSSYQGRLGEHYTVMVGSGKNRHAETRTRWFTVSGNYDGYFPNVIVESSSRLDQKTIDKMGNYNVDEAVSYKKEYLAGFSAERYDNSLKNCFDINRGKVDEWIKRNILSRYKYDVVDYLNVNTDYRSVRFRHVLMPLWACGYYYKQKLYNFFVNGKTGKSAGKAPLSPIRVGLAVLLGLAALAGIIYGIVQSGILS